VGEVGKVRMEPSWKPTANWEPSGEMSNEVIFWGWRVELNGWFEKEKACEAYMDSIRVDGYSRFGSKISVGGISSGHVTVILYTHPVQPAISIQLYTSSRTHSDPLYIHPRHQPHRLPILLIKFNMDLGIYRWERSFVAGYPE
jgi:hypothetical protein